MAAQRADLDYSTDSVGNRGAAAPPAAPVGRSDRVLPVSVNQRYRLRNPASGREIVLEAEPGEIYLDRDSGEQLEAVGRVLPLAPSTSRLPWAVENLRFCNWCDQLAQKDLNDCPTCGRRMGPLRSPAGDR
jgi:hypothetical protein